nr:hypothetical protein [uncultured Cohaesibacter sp.]
MTPTFAFDLDQKVKMKLSDEQGLIIGRAEFVMDTPNYLVRYLAADGRQVESWWNESAIEKI